MEFLNRNDEFARLDSLIASEEGGLAVVYGRRRIGKTRLLLEWTQRHLGLYTVADQSVAEIQRRYFAEAVSKRLPGFADVEYRDWRALLDRLAREANQVGWRGPIVFDELPYLVLASPELPSVLQRWIDHEARQARLIVALAGSSQRMMQGFVLAANAPLFGRAREILHLQPLDVTFLNSAFHLKHPADAIALFAAWGGVPRYWELARGNSETVSQQIDRLVLDPLSPLHREPDRLLLEELPPAPETRPLLDAIGSGAHRVSEIAGRIGRPATSLGRPLNRLQEMALVRRETPFGEAPRKTRRALYKIDDPFIRLWFRVVAPHRAQLASVDQSGRLQILARFWPHLIAQAWEDLCRARLPRVSRGALGELGRWGPGGRWWQGRQPEWDVVSASLDGEHLLLGEVKWSEKAFDAKSIERLARDVATRPAPILPSAYKHRKIFRVLFVPHTSKPIDPPVGLDGLITAADLLS